MGKRSSLVVLSSSDEEADNATSLNLNRSYSKQSSKSFVTRTNPRQPSKRPRLSRESRKYSDEIRFPIYDDFDEFFYGSKVSAANSKATHGSGHESSNVKELWVDKYKPQSLEELAVHKKKVEEVKAWFEKRLKASEENLSNYVLVITGQAGTGKSITINTIASHFGATLFEWKTPTPTIWQEHMHNTNRGISYTSKLDDFVNFSEKIRKYGLFPSSFSAESKPPIILLIDDLPVANGRVAFEKLQSCLLLLARSTQVPTAILLTDYGKEDPADHSARFLEELQLSLESAGACKVSFNPITNNSIKKVITRICKQEHHNLTTEQIDLIAKASGGDIRHAITSLQLFCVQPNIMPNLSALSNSSPSYSDGSADEINALISGFSSLFGRDETLSLFHALGKFLHNKRDAEVPIVLDHDAFLVSDKFSRLPMKMDAPEKVLCQAHGQARPITDFLHENVLDFISDEGMDAARDVASYLSDVDLLLYSFRGMSSRSNEANNVLQSAAASVAVRGVLFGNSCSSSSRWHAIRKPKLWQVDQSMFRNQKETISRKFIADGGSSFSQLPLSDIATEYMPVLKWLGHRASGVEVHQVLERHNEAYDDSSEQTSLDREESQISDDEIEEW
ncbi:cell cycle checkpoint protein RAD17 isoform X2 [Mercurialis annua]|uniref:cell cycle checkpoint protein RAD17 isoform X2 n=1 Tax=Mercurialis annua TaxID=3986 RepID=UPI002160BE18|nr:cell cycle checkpoint protein RAD17 isoform X2 [Mercurialis annua]